MLKNIDEKSMFKFIENTSIPFRSKGAEEIDLNQLNNIDLNYKECIYLMDFVKNKVTYSRGFENVLGYPEKDITLDFIINNHHPEDSELVNRISKATILYCMENPEDILNVVLFISYRRKKKDGSYLKVLSESCIYEINDQGLPTKGFAKITDISFVNSSDIVSWSLVADNLNKEEFKKLIYAEYIDFFTKREKDIIKEIANGFTNGSISKNLNISKYTVETHRKNILKKANVHNIDDLILFCKRKGIV